MLQYLTLSGTIQGEYQSELSQAGVYLVTQESQNFGGYTQKGTAPKLKFIGFEDLKIVYIGVIDPTESQSGLIFE